MPAGEAQGAAQQPGEAVEAATWLVFELAREAFAVPVSTVQEVRSGSDLGAVQAPAPPEVCGLLDGGVPVVDLAALLALPPEEDVEPKVLVLRLSGAQAPGGGPRRKLGIGVRVDGIRHLLRVPPSAVHSLPEEVLSPQSRGLLGVCRYRDEWIILLGVEELLRSTAAGWPSKLREEG